jgi:hypothetical protein
MSNNLTARSQANPAPLASSILSNGTVQMVTLWPRKTGLQLTLWICSQFVVPSTEGWVKLGVLTYRRLGAAVTGVEVDAPMTRAAQMTSTMGGTALVPGRLAQQW